MSLFRRSLATLQPRIESGALNLPKIRKALVLVSRFHSPRGCGLSSDLGSYSPVASPFGDLHSDLALLSALKSARAIAFLELRLRHRP